MKRILPGILAAVILGIALGILWGIVARAQHEYQERLTPEEYAAQWQEYLDHVQKFGRPTVIGTVPESVFYVAFSCVVLLLFIAIYEALKFGLQRLLYGSEKTLPDPALQQPGGAGEPIKP